MDLIVEHADVYAVSVRDVPGALAAKLTVLAEAGADLDFVISRRAPEKPGPAVVFVTPLHGDQEIRAAAVAGFAVSSSMHSVRIEGDNRQGIAAELTRKISEAEINLHGVSAAVIGTKFVMYVSLDTADDAEKTMELLLA